MTGQTGQSGRVLIVEDERELAKLYAGELRGFCTVDLAHTGADAVERISANHDVVLLDRRLPDTTGSDVLAQIESEDLDCRVAMVTAVNPDFDIIDLGIDDYLVKPATRQEIRETVERLLALDGDDDSAQELTSKRRKRAVLEGEKTTGELRGNAAFAGLTNDIERLENSVETENEERGGADS